MDVGTLTALIVAATGLIGATSAYLLGKRGQQADKNQQDAKHRLEKRIAAFDELESLNDRLEKENTRLRELLVEAEATGDLRLSRQARRCRERLDETTAALAVLQSVVLAEVSRVAAADAVQRAADHIADDHPDLDDEP
jgi:hypothetical protein